MSLVDNPIVVLEQTWGDDLTVCNAARVSFAKRSDKMCSRDIKLINYLAEHEHHTPFRHAGATFVITCPVFVARQIHKHQVGVSINEMSGRYVEMDREDYFRPRFWRESAENVKQGSSPHPVSGQHELHDAYFKAMRVAYDTYYHLVDAGVCKEQARAVLPQAMLTQFWMSASLQAWAHFVRLRADSHAQREIQVYAAEVDKTLREKFPHSWEALLRDKHK